LWHLLICDNTFFLISLFKMRHVIFSLNEYVMLCYCTQNKWSDGIWHKAAPLPCTYHSVIFARWCQGASTSHTWFRWPKWVWSLLSLGLASLVLALAYWPFRWPWQLWPCGLPTRLSSGMSHRASVLSGRCLLSMLQAVSTGWPQKSKLLILSEYLNETEKIGGTWTNTNSYRGSEALPDIFTWNVFRHSCFTFKYFMTESSQWKRRIEVCSIEYLTTEIEIIVANFQVRGNRQDCLRNYRIFNSRTVF